MITKHDLERADVAPPIPYASADNIPKQLRDVPSWVLWRYQQSDDRWTKVLKQPFELNVIGPAKSNDPTTWGPFTDTHENYGGINGAYEFHDAHRPGKYGYGFVLSANDPFAVIDLDDCRDRETGEITTEARAVIDQFASYTEVSPSGTGVKIFIRAAKPGERCRTNDRPGVEVYDRLRFVAITGCRVEGCPTEPQNRQLELETYYRELFPEPTPAQRPERPPTDHRPDAPTLTIADDAEVIRRASAAANGAKFDRLWSGDAGDYEGDESAADFALAAMLAFWVGNDAGRIIGLMWQSGLRRDKWKRPDYLPRTVARAITGRTTFYGDRLFSGVMGGDGASETVLIDPAITTRSKESAEGCAYAKRIADEIDALLAAGHYPAATGCRQPVNFTDRLNEVDYYGVGVRCRCNACQDCFAFKKREYVAHAADVLTIVQPGERPGCPDDVGKDAPDMTQFRTDALHQWEGAMTELSVIRQRIRDAGGSVVVGHKTDKNGRRYAVRKPLWGVFWLRLNRTDDRVWVVSQVEFKDSTPAEPGDVARRAANLIKSAEPPPQRTQLCKFSGLWELDDDDEPRFIRSIPKYKNEEAFRRFVAGGFAPETLRLSERQKRKGLTDFPGAFKIRIRDRDGRPLIDEAAYRMLQKQMTRGDDNPFVDDDPDTLYRRDDRPFRGRARGRPEEAERAIPD